MGKILIKLGLQQPLPKDLTDDADSIKASVQKLNLSKQQQKDLALEGNAKTVAGNLAALKKKIEPALYDFKRDEFTSLTSRIAQRKKTDPALLTDAAELNMLTAETEVALKDNKANRQKLEQAKQGFADALVTRLDSGGDLAADLKTYFDNLIEGESSARMTAALKALGVLQGSQDQRVKDAAAKVSKQLVEENQKRQKALGPSMAERDAPRTPNDVLVHLMSEVNTALKTHTDDAGLKKVVATGRKLFMTHEFDGPAVAKLVDDAKTALERLADVDAWGRCDKLSGQLPPEDYEMSPAQLQDNLYGRVFDTKMIHSLVKNPPDELLESSSKAGAAFADGIDENEPINKEAAKKLRKEYIIDDIRPWSKAVPGFQAIEDAKTDAEALQAIKTFLKTPPTTGQEIIAFSFVMTKMAICQQGAANSEGEPTKVPGYMTKAGANYGQVIQKQAVRERGTSEKANTVLSEGAGITMLHQPSAVDDDTLVPSERPGTVNRFGNRKGPDSGKDLSEMERTKATEVQHEHSLPFASGVSGSTNIMLHMYEDLVAKGMTGVGSREFLMNAMMFLVYDGGHSMHEVMWTANQLDEKLNLNLGLGDPDKPTEFVSDYDVLVDGFGDNMKVAMQGAMDEAWTGTQDYLQENSFFAQ